MKLRQRCGVWLLLGIAIYFVWTSFGDCKLRIESPALGARILGRFARVDTSFVRKVYILPEVLNYLTPMLLSVLNPLALILI